MADPRPEGFEPSANDDLETIASLCRYNIDCAESLANELSAIQSLAEEALKKLGK